MSRTTISRSSVRAAESLLSGRIQEREYRGRTEMSRKIYNRLSLMAVSWLDESTLRCKGSAANVWLISIRRWSNRSVSISISGIPQTTGEISTTRTAYLKSFTNSGARLFWALWTNSRFLQDRTFWKSDAERG